MSKTKTTPSQSPAKSRKSTGTTSTNRTVSESLQIELEKFEAICASLRAALDEEKEVADYDPEVIRRWKQRDMDENDLLLLYEVKMYSKDRLLARVEGSTDLRNILDRACVAEAPERFGFQFTGQVWQPIRSKFEKVINGMHDRAALSGESTYSLDGRSNNSGQLKDPEEVAEPPAVMGVLPGTDDI